MFEKMDYVYEVYRERSFSKAAKKLYISQPSLSAAVRKVEEKIGFPIFDRTTNPVGLTELGQQYIRSVEELRSVESAFKNYLDDIDKMHIGKLTIGATNFYASHILPPMLKKFTERYPEISIDLVEGVSPALIKSLSDGGLDLLIDNTEHDEWLYKKKFYCREQILLAVPGSFLSNRDLDAYALTAENVKRGVHLAPEIPCVPLRCFHGEPFLLLRNGNNTRERAERICREADFVPTVKMELAQQITAYNYACEGMGICFAADLLVRHVPNDNSLRYYKLEGKSAERSVHFYYRRNRYVSRAIRAFLELLDEIRPEIELTSHEVTAII